MKTLYESILGSTKSGKIKLIKNWCDENIITTILSREHPYEINSDDKIVPDYPGNQINLKSWDGKPVPSYIKFGDLGKSNFAISNMINGMKPEQLPENCSVFYISGEVDTIRPIRIKAQFGFAINFHRPLLKKIEKLEIECNTKNNRKPIIDLSNSKVNLENVLNITVIGDIYSLKLKKTPAAKELLKIFKKQELKSEPDLNRGFISKELNDMFKNFPELRYIEIGDRTTLEHNPKTDRWYKI